MNNKGFTLIEVLVSIIIIMILATYSVLKYTETVHDGENRTAKAQLEVVAGGYTRYLMENPGKVLSGALGYVNGECSATCEACAEGQGKFSCGKIPVNKLKYKITLGDPASGNTGCGNSIATMQAISGEKVGDKFALESGYCAYIDRFGRAVDGNTTAE